MPRNCKCAGKCTPESQSVSRRDFIALMGAGTLVGAPAWGDWVEQQMPAGELAAWKADLLTQKAPRKYRSDKHTDARMHLGGIGTGNVEIGADGQWTTWQLFNTLTDGHVPFYFGVHAGGVAKLLQTAGGPKGLPTVKAIEMTGEYPCAVLKFEDGELPVDVEMTAFSPFAPLDTRLSSMPVACVVLKVRNKSGRRLTVSLASMLLNPVGYDARGGIDGVRHPNLGFDVTTPFVAGKVAGLDMTAVAAKGAALEKPIYVSTNLDAGGLNAPPKDRPNGMSVRGLDQVGSHDKALPEVIWLEDAAATIAAATWQAVRDAVSAGATLVLSGARQPLLGDYARLTGGKPLGADQGKPDIVFEDFESGYGNWTVEGEAFGKEPAKGTLEGQQPVSGFVGKGLVNSYLGGDVPTGKMTSKDFTVERGYIRLLVGGGRHPDTQVRLVVDGKVVRAASGNENEKLEPVVWDVRDLQGKTAHFEIVDGNSGGWGHINVDQIEFVDVYAPREALAALDELLPVRLSDARPAAGGALELSGVTPKDGCKAAALRNGRKTWAHAVGQGRVVLVGGGILDPGQTRFSLPRMMAYPVLCEAAGLKCEAPDGQCVGAEGFGAVALATTGPRPSAATGAADFAAVWGEFAKSGRFTPADQAGASKPTSAGETSIGALACSVTLEVGKSAEVPFFLAWRFPNDYSDAGKNMGAHYATVWPNARAVVDEVAANWAAIRGRTESFRKTAYDTSLPYYLTDCLTSQAAIIRHRGIVFRIANGDPYGWEGSNGCCQPTCTHVWGYEQSLSRLFPDLEREMRRIDFINQQDVEGGVHNRTEVPSPKHPTGERPFADGHASCILKCYREALNHSDESWMREYWPHVRKGVDYLINRDAATSGGTPNGTLEDDQWNTYDEALHGVTAFISGYYLAALRAGEEWAKRVGDKETAARFHGVFEKGQKRLVDVCWEGEYFRQDLPDYQKRWGEVGPGCMADQLIGQWWAHQLGLGYILPEDKVKSALKAVFKYNWMPDLTGWKHSPRAFAGAKDKGLIICTWPKGGRPDGVMLYSDEVWTGIEYQVAAHMIYEGMIEEGLSIVKGVRERYDGVPKPPIPRNPWNEIECGGHYARAMSSWSLLLALSGWRYDALTGELRVAPAVTPDKFGSLFVASNGWGGVRQTRSGKSQTIELQVVEGKLSVAKLDTRFAGIGERAVVRAAMGRVPVEGKLQRSGDEVSVVFGGPVVVNAGQTLVVMVG